LYEGVCEVDFTLTRPYIMQISTFGLDPVATSDSDFLKDFYDMEGERLVESTNINETIDVDSSDYGFDSSVLNQMTDYKSKYESLAILVNNSFEIRDGVTI
jgi:hypothetical protein